jgi:23S rRNA (adenine2503-C2)-methyltransferase
VRTLQDRLAAAGAGPRHARRVLSNWLAGQDLRARRSRSDADLPRALLDELPALAAELDALARLARAEPGADGSERLLARLGDGRTIECVRLPSRSLCASTQVGCAVGCLFCRTGQDGLARQLTSAEIAAQVALARRRGAVRRVLFMGMGEPAHNLDATLEAVEALADLGGIGHKDLVVSSVGERRLFERLTHARVKPALALSLHTLDAGKRARLLPRAPRIDPLELVALADAYARSSGHPVQYQWTLLAGVNDGEDELERIERAFAGRHGVLNLIPWNAVDGAHFRRPEEQRMRAAVRRLHAAGILTKLRRTAGADVEGACGQLRARSLEELRA